ncbi:hypothetical protein ACOMCU_01065 [Lysinibacillus sp. UGB7]|uniref:hypothetical protein n=1 Tax=Lysinibacillus sp. UGB7 TaxID=3411039 RepID=UPI003B7F4DC9
MTLLFGCSNGEESKVSKVNTEIIEATTEEKVATPIERVSQLSYKEAAKTIATMTAKELEDTTGDVRVERIKLMVAYAEQYAVSEADSIQFTADLINAFTAGTYLENIDNDEVVLVNVFKATIVSNTADDPLVDFAEHYNDSMKNLFIEAYTVNGEIVQKNEAEMSKALQLASHMQEINK